MAKKVFDKRKVVEISKLANLEFSPSEIKYFERQFNETISYVENFNKLDTSKVETTFQVTGLTNVFREDRVSLSRILSQKDALSGAKRVIDGYFVVKGVLDEK